MTGLRALALLVFLMVPAFAREPKLKLARSQSIQRHDVGRQMGVATDRGDGKAG